MIVFRILVIITIILIIPSIELKSQNEISCEDLCNLIYSKNDIRPLDFLNVIEELEIQNLKNSKDSINIRIWYDGFLVDLSMSHFNSFNGIIYRYVVDDDKNERYFKRTSHGKKAKIPKILFAKYVLEPSYVENLVDTLVVSNIFELSTRSQISGYELVYDGYWFTIELFNGSNHTCHNFDNLDSQPQVEEIILATRIFSIFSTVPYNKAVLDLKPGAYITNSYGVIIELKE